MDVMEKAIKLAERVSSLEGFAIPDEVDGDYRHMGATVSDAILQAGIAYETVVKPRVLNLKTEYPSANTTSGFASIAKEIGLGRLLNWKGQKKLQTITNTLSLFAAEKVENESQLRDWLQVDGNIGKLKSIRGIGDKTADYLKILVGISTIAIDRHLLNFLKDSQIQADGYGEAQEIISLASSILGIDEAHFDHAIWLYMSGKGPSSGATESQ